jgi:hypothetical protein
MKIFDYKFIILLGLTLVVYFIYREVEYLRSKINKIEKDIHSNKLSQEPLKIVNVKPTEKITETITPELPVEQKTKVSVEETNDNVLLQPIKVSTQYQNIIDNDQSLFGVCSVNIPYIDPHLLMNFKNELSNMELNIISDTVINADDLIQLPDNTKKINNLIIIDEDVSEHCEITKQSSPSHLAVYSNENESCEDKVNNTHDDKPDFNYDGIKESQPDNNDLVIEKLDKYKLIEIKKIAEGRKININKKVNGAYKPKTKNELIMEIIELKNI